MKTCKDCKFYDNELEHEGQKYGFCYWWPPEALAENKSTYPVVKATNRQCGQFKRRWFGK